MATEGSVLELYHFNEQRVQNYANALNQFAQNMPESVRMYALLAPTKVGLTNEAYQDYSDPQEKAIDYAYALLDSRYQTVNVFSKMYDHREEYLHFRSDHHWTQLGAYYAAKAFSEQAGFALRDLTEYKRHSRHGFLGYLYHKTKDKEVAKNPDRVDVYTYTGEDPKISNYYYQEDGKIAVSHNPVVNTKGNHANYRVFLGGDFPLAVYKAAGRETGRRILIVKDSYANAFVTWLTPYFDKIVLVDPRHFRGSLYDLAVKENITDFMVLDYIMATELEGYIAFLHKLGK